MMMKKKLISWYLMKAKNVKSNTIINLKYIDGIQTWTTLYFIKKTETLQIEKSVKKHED